MRTPNIILNSGGGSLNWALAQGTRQDSKTEAAFAAYWNRPFNVEYLKSAAYGNGDLLKDNLYCMLTSLEIIATMRGRAAFHDKFTSPLRFFSASNDLDAWSALDMARVLELTRRALKDIIARPELALDAAYDPFRSLEASVPAYVDFKRKLAAATALAVDGKTRLPSISAVRAEIYSPQDPTNVSSTARTLEQVKAFATGMLNTMTNGQASRFANVSPRHSNTNPNPNAPRAARRGDTLLSTRARYVHDIGFVWERRAPADM